MLASGNEHDLIVAALALAILALVIFIVRR